MPAYMVYYDVYHRVITIEWRNWHSSAAQLTRNTPMRAHRSPTAQMPLCGIVFVFNQHIIIDVFVRRRPGKLCA